MKNPFSSMRAWLMFWLLIVASLPLITFVIIDYYKELRNIEEYAKQKLSAVRDLKVRYLDQWTDERTADLTLLSDAPILRAFASTYSETKSLHEDEDPVHREAQHFLERVVASYDAYQSAYIVNAESGRIILATDARLRGRIFGLSGFVSSISNTQKIEFSHIYGDLTLSKTPQFHVAVMILRDELAGISISSLMLVLNIDVVGNLYPLLNDHTRLGETGESLLVSHDSLALSEFRWKDNAVLNYRVSAEPATRAVSGQTGFIIAHDYRGTKVAAAYTYLPKFGWGLVAKQDYEEIAADLNSRTVSVIWWLLIGWAFVGALGLLLASKLTSPLQEMAAISHRISAGNLSERLRDYRFSELSTMAQAFNSMIGVVEKDLLSTRRSIRIITRISQSHTMQQLAEEACAAMIKDSGVMVSAFYALDRMDQSLRPIAAVGTYADSLPAYSSDRMTGTISHALLNNEIHFLKDLDQTTFRFDTVAGVARPAEIATLPLVVDEALVGAVILAKALPFSETDQLTLQKIWPELRFAIARAIQIDERRRLLDDLQEKNQELETMAEELQQQSEELQLQNLTLEDHRLKIEMAYNEKSTFLSNVSHELRTPLNAILSLTHALQMQLNDRITTEEQEYIEVMRRNGKQLLAIINDLLELSRLDSGKFELKYESLDCKSIIEQILESLQPVAAEKGLVLHRNLPEGLPVFMSDRRTFEMILQNLLSNAVKFTEEGSIEVTLAINETQLHCEIRDTGIGISQEDLPNIFSEFRQVDGSSSRRYGGVGLGLAIVRKGVEELGGSIDVKSIENSGSVFTLVLPASDNRKSTESSRVGKRNRRPMNVVNAEGQGNSRQHVMIVDDNDDVIVQLQAVLQQDGYKITSVSDGNEAVKRILEEKPEALILDLMIPGKDGFEILKEIRQHSALASLPVLILTAKAVTKEEARFLTHAMVKNVLTKGVFDEEDLLHEIYSLFED